MGPRKPRRPKPKKRTRRGPTDAAKAEHARELFRYWQELEGRLP